MSTRVKRTGAPSFAPTQRDEVLRLLREAGPAGVRKAELIFDRHYTQCAARIFELQKAGYKICSEQRDGERYVTYVLESEPFHFEHPSSDSPDWYECQNGGKSPRGDSYESKRVPIGDWYTEKTGRLRPTGQPDPPPSKLPLFEGVS